MSRARKLPLSNAQDFAPLWRGRHRLPKWDWAGPWCAFILREKGIAVIPIRDRQERRESHARRGLPYEACGNPASHEVDGAAYCERHAGAIALEILMEEPK